jgi:hypothetical protein
MVGWLGIVEYKTRISIILPEVYVSVLDCVRSLVFFFCGNVVHTGRIRNPHEIWLCKYTGRNDEWYLIVQRKIRIFFGRRFWVLKWNGTAGAKT